MDDFYLLSAATVAHNKRKPDSSFAGRPTGLVGIFRVILLENNWRASPVLANAVNMLALCCASGLGLGYLSQGTITLNQTTAQSSLM